MKSCTAGSKRNKPHTPSASTPSEQFQAILPIDGSGHRGDYDLRREKKLQIATIRLTPEALMAEDFTIDFLHSVRARVQNYRSVIPVA